MEAQEHEERLFHLFEGSASQDKAELDPKIAFDLGTGRMLLEARLQRDMSLADVAQALILPERVIEAIENREYSKIPSIAYATGYVRAYAELVQLDADELIKADPDLGLSAITNDVSSSQEITAPPAAERSFRDRLKVFSSLSKAIFALILVTALVLGWVFREDISTWFTELVISGKISQVEESADPQNFQPLSN